MGIDNPPLNHVQRPNTFHVSAPKPRCQFLNSRPIITFAPKFSSLGDIIQTLDLLAIQITPLTVSCTQHSPIHCSFGLIIPLSIRIKKSPQPISSRSALWQRPLAAPRCLYPNSQPPSWPSQPMYSTKTTWPSFKTWTRAMACFQKVMGIPTLPAQVAIYHMNGVLPHD